MATLNERKVVEGMKFLKEAEKCLQTSWLKWKPDYDNAADKFTKAATAFKVGKSYDQAKDAFLKAADAHLKNNSLYHSGKALEQAGTMLKEMKKIDEAAELMEKAGALYQQNGTTDTAAMVLVKAAKICEGTHLQRAVELYQKAGELREVDDKLREAADPYNKAIQLLIKQQKFENAVNSMTKQLELYARIGNSAVQYKIILGLVVVHLYDGDYVAADKCFKDAFEVPGFGLSEEAESIENLLEAYDQSDAERIKTIVAKPLFRYLDNELSKLARDLKPSEEFNISHQTTELRVISSDIAKLTIDETRPSGGRLVSQKGSEHSHSEAPQLIDDEEENPLGSEQKEASATSDERTSEGDDAAESSGKIEHDTSNDEHARSGSELETTADKLSAGGETERTGKNEEMDKNEEEEEDFEGEGGLC